MERVSLVVLCTVDILEQKSTEQPHRDGWRPFNIDMIEGIMYFYSKMKKVDMGFSFQHYKMGLPRIGYIINTLIRQGYISVANNNWPLLYRITPKGASFIDSNPLCRNVSATLSRIVSTQWVLGKEAPIESITLIHRFHTQYNGTKICPRSMTIACGWSIGEYMWKRCLYFLRRLNLIADTRD